MLPRLIDSHIHLDHADFDADRQALLAQSLAAGIEAWIVPATTVERWPLLDQLQAAYPQRVFCAYGLHPWFLHRVDELEQAIKQLEQQLSCVPAVAIGECGLDFFTNRPPEPLQRQALEAQLQLAKAHQLPVILHACRAVDPVLKAVRLAGLDRGGVLHGFSGSVEQAKRAVDLGLKIGLGGRLTHARAGRLHAVAKCLPAEALLLETDGPHQAGRRYRNQRHSPLGLTDVWQALLALRAEPASELAATLNHTTRRLFAIEPAA